MIYNLSFVINISIHAPHEGERHLGDAYVWGAQGISIHAPHEGERPCGAFATHNRKEIFQSTLPTRGSDPFLLFRTAATVRFQSTLPTRGSDQHRYAILRRAEKFQSTLPTRGSDCTGVV